MATRPLLATSRGRAVIHRLVEADVPAIFEVIGDAATAYRTDIPADCWREPYLSEAELRDEIAAGVEFFGWAERANALQSNGPAARGRRDPHPPRAYTDG